MLPWELTTVKAFIQDHGITVDDFSPETPGVHKLIRDLMVLAAREVLTGDGDRSIQRLARAMLERCHA